jgi:AmmeMemoRadiSam system protein B
MGAFGTMSGPELRRPAVAGSFYPADPDRLIELVEALVGAAGRVPGAAPVSAGSALPLGVLVPHAGLTYSGITAAAGWRSLAGHGGRPPVIVILGTNHSAGWLDGVGAWEAGAWSTPSAVVPVHAELAHEIVALGGPFHVDHDAHRREHSIEVQLPLLAALEPDSPVVPLAVSCATGPRAIGAGERLGRLLGDRRAGGEPVVLAISTDMAHYPPAAECAAVTERLLPSILALDPAALAALEEALRGEGIPGLGCGMCGIEPAVLGLAALRAMGATGGTALAASTSADAGGPADRVVGYLAVRFDA